ncbi:MAG: TIGR02680 family protein [Pseudonocardia sp.]
MTAIAPARTRFRPTRAGIVNLWDYRDEEFVFAGGRLVLRGPNGSGKTKALEVLFPFVLDGRIEPRRLNPFASEDRTMRSNLLYRGQPSGYGYVWMEFVGSGAAVTVGIGLQAGRHTDRVKRWYFVVDGRVGVDFSLLTPDDRPLTRAQLIAELGSEAVRDTPSEHRAAVDARLFGLGRERFEQLLTLVLTLRRPQLAKNLDPAKLSDTLTDGLRPLDEDLLAEAARSFDDMEAVARTLDGLVRADDAAASFLTAYTTYLRGQARTAADALTGRRAAVAHCVADVAGARQRLDAAQVAREVAAARVRDAETAAAAVRARLDQLKASTAYQAHEQLADLQKLVAELGLVLDGARSRLARRAEQRRQAETAASRAGEHAARLHAEAGRVARELADDAAAAGVAWDADDAEPGGFDERVAARVAAREDDVRAVQAAVGELGRAEHARRAAAEAADRADRAVAGATAAEEQAGASVEQARAEARKRLAAWADRHAATVTELAVPGLVEALAGAVDAAGESDTADPRAVFARSTAGPVQAARDELAALRAERRRQADEVADLEERRRAVAAARDAAPGAAPTRSAPRTGRPGAPLWRLVRFTDAVDGAAAAGLEGALEAAGLLDAWVHPDAGSTAAALAAVEADGYLVPLPAAGRPEGPTLESVLEPEDTDLVPVERVQAVLGSVALLPPGSPPDPGRACVSPQGLFGQGVLVGGYRKTVAGFVGATARARRRAARLAELDGLLAVARARIDDVDRIVARTQAVLDAVTAAAAELPRVGPIVEAVRRHDQAAGLLRGAREAADAARAVLDQAVGEVGARDRELRRTAAERVLAPDAVDVVSGALVRFGRAAARLGGVRRQQDDAAEAVAEARGRLEQAHDDESVAAADEERAARRSAEESERLDVLHRTMGAQAQQVLAEVARAEADVTAAGAERSAAADAKEEAAGAAARAEAERDAAGSALRLARTEEHTAAHRLEPFADDDVLRLLRCPAGLCWPVHEDWVRGDQADGTGDLLPDAVVALHEAILAATGELRPTEASVKQATTRLDNALRELSAELSAAGHDYRPEWGSASGIILVRVIDERGPAAIGAFAGRIAQARRDQEQLLTESERRVLEDALLSQLARQIHERTVDARDLIARMNAEMRGRRMSSGLTIGVRWELADTLVDEHRAVVRLMERDAAGLGPDELGRMRMYFAGAIKAARAARPDRGYRELLGEVLDYRRWRAFALFLHPAGGGEERLTRARHGQLSGGEQSVSLHLPLFAAAHAMFDSADQACPRLLALDEAFAGVDDKGRTELFGLASEFDFDLVMTGYDLWATYATVPAAAHYDLSHSPAEHTVSALLMVWDGSGTDADVDGELAVSLGSPQTRRRPGRGGGLLDELEPDPEPEPDEAE